MAETILKGKTGVIVNYRRGRHTQNTKHILLNFNFPSYQEATRVIGKEIEWKSPAGKILKGKIVSLHGKNGIVRAIFDKGLPGAAIGQPVTIR
ncbi:MAG TPA: 50S ribosomal protein L35ae [Candidatus Deferrimicrobium sp.]|nr:50S ribosomal protein L35ae [Candidatus Deferrimicrobium sp.]